MEEEGREKEMEKGEVEGKARRKKRGRGEERRKFGKACLVGRRGPSWAQSRSPRCAVAALWFQPEAPASTLRLSMITGEAIRRISGFVIKGDSTKACDNKMLRLGAK